MPADHWDDIRRNDESNWKVQLFVYDRHTSFLLVFAAEDTKRQGNNRSESVDMTTPAHPGQVLGKLAAIGVLPTDLARQLHVPANRITQAIQGRHDITDDFVLRLAHWLGDAPEFRMGLQAQRELRETTREVGREIRSLPRQPAQAGVR